jgi:UDP-N-acetylglucosamine 2-epimerase
VLANEQWKDAVLVTEDALKTCAAQVLACIEHQAPTAHHDGAPMDLGPSGPKI